MPFQDAVDQKRERILSWLQLKARRVFAEYPQLLRAVIEGDYSSLRLGNDKKVPIEGVTALYTAVEYSGLAHAGIEPSQLLIEIAKGELTSQGAPN